MLSGEALFSFKVARECPLLLPLCVRRGGGGGGVGVGLAMSLLLKWKDDKKA